jgi:hypothetical protein
MNENFKIIRKETAVAYFIYECQNGLRARKFIRMAGH